MVCNDYAGYPVNILSISVFFYKNVCNLFLKFYYKLQYVNARAINIFLMVCNLNFPSQ